MSSTSPLRRGIAVLAILASSFPATVSSPAVGAPGPGPGAEPRAAAAPVAHRTRLRFTVPGCEGCRFQLHRVRESDGTTREWHSRTRRVHDGRVTFTPRSRRTFGMTVTVIAPWEGHTGYLTTVAFRYGGKAVGDPVTFLQARHKRRASACWEGTRRDAVTIPLVVRRVMVRGVRHRVRGSIAYTPSTQVWRPPMRRAIRGVLGSQDFDICG